MALAKSYLCAFFMMLDMAVWQTLQAVLVVDCTKQLHFQKSSSVKADEAPSMNQSANKNSDEKGTLKFFWGLKTCTIPLQFTFPPNLFCRQSWF